MKTSSIKLIWVILLLLSVTVSFSQTEEMRRQEAEMASKVNTRIDNNGYWKLKASQGLAKLNPVYSIPPAKYTGSGIRALSVITEDSPDVPVAPPNTTQSETSIFVNPEDNNRVLNSNNSSANPMTSFYGADALRSEDAGLTWGGTVFGPAGSNSGDPVALIGNNGWYYVNYISNSLGQAVDYSQDGGNNWTRVNIASSSGGILDKNHMWIDNSPASTYNGHLYCAWTDFGAIYDSEIGLSASTDEGLTWSSVKNVSAAVNAGSHNQGVNIATGPSGEVYAVWTIYDGWPTDETAIGMARSFDGGASFEPAERIVTNIRGIRNSGVNKNMRVNSFPVCAVDISGGEYNGNIYIVWTNIGTPGVNTGTDADVYIVRSEDQGETWSEPVRVNQDPSGQGKKHYFPWISCDPETGILSVIFYDDRNVGGDQCEVYCANSYDAGETWEDFKVSDVAFTPTPIAGLADGYMGDYIGINARGGIVYPVWMDNRSGSVMAYVSPFETNPLSRPTNLTGEVTFETGAVDLTWNFEEEPGFSYFKIFRDGDSIGTSADTTYQDMLPDYGIYSYRVTAYFDGLGESNPSSTRIQWGDAHIFVTPDSIHELVLPDESKTKYVTVINTGELEMEYVISPLIMTSDEGGRGTREYCEASNGCDEFISRVVLENIDNSSGCSGYGDYTNLSTLMMAGNTYEITVVNGNPIWSADECGIWIDWNLDEEFSEDESIPVNGTPGVGPYSASITPPSNALPGTTRMRIRIVYAETPEPCGYSSYGETEDYSIDVVNWLNLDPYSGNIMPGDTNQIAVHLDAAGLEVGDYMAELRITSNDPDNSLVTVPVTMQVREISLSVFSDQHSICQGDTVNLSSELIGGSASATFQWSSMPEGFYSDTSHTFATPDTTTTYTLLVTDGDIQVSDDVMVVVFPLPELELGENMEICQGDSITLDAGEGHHWYLWNTGDTIQAITVFEGGEYWVTVANEHECTISDTMMVTVHPLPELELGENMEICQGDSITLDAGEGHHWYLWNTGDTIRAITVFEAGEYWVTVASEHECSISDTMMVTIHPVPSVELGKDTVLCYYHEIVLDAGNPGSTYLWSTGEDSQAITVDSTGMVAGLKTVSVDVTSADGCMSSDTIYVSFIECLSIDENAISEELQVYPNPGDGRFAITLDSDKAIKGTLILTSTSGKVVYQKKDILLVPGSHQNVNLQMLPDGVYTLHFISENKLYQKRLIIKG